jgi:hypothetical protein
MARVEVAAVKRRGCEDTVVHLIHAPEPMAEADH